MKKFHRKTLVSLEPSVQNCPVNTVDAGYKQLGYKKTRLLPTNFFPPAKLFFIMYYKNSDTRNSLIRKLGFKKANFFPRLIQKLGYKKPKPKVHVHFQENFTHSKKPKVHVHLDT